MRPDEITPKLLTLGLVALTLSGCLTAEQKTKFYSSQRPATAAERRIIAGYVRDTFFDPYSIRDASISGVFNSVMQAGARSVCIYVNAKNRMGAYTGRTYTSIRFNNSGVIISDTSEATNALCSDPQVRYVTFHEVNA